MLIELGLSILVKDNYWVCLGPNCENNMEWKLFKGAGKYRKSPEEWTLTTLFGKHS